MAEWWPTPDGVRVGPDGDWNVGEFRIAHLPSLRFLKARLVFEDEGAFLVEGVPPPPRGRRGPGVRGHGAAARPVAGEARVLLDDGNEEVLGPDSLGTEPQHGPRRVPGPRRAGERGVLARGAPGAARARRGDARALLPPRGEPPLSIRAGA